MIPRKFSYKTSWLNFPRGISPSDDEGIQFAERAIRQLTGAQNVQVSFDSAPDGTPLLDQMRVYVEHPVKQGSMVNLSALEAPVAKALADVINSLAGDGDASAQIDKLKQVASGGGDDEEEGGVPNADAKKPPFGGGDKPSGGNIDALEEGGASGGPSVPPSGPANAPSGNKPRLPFASRNASREERRVRAQRTANLQRDLGVDFKQAAQIYRIIASSPRFADALPRLQRLVVDENDRPLPQAEYVRIAKVARGEAAPLV